MRLWLLRCLSESHRWRNQIVSLYSHTGHSFSSFYCICRGLWIPHLVAAQTCSSSHLSLTTRGLFLIYVVNKVDTSNSMVWASVKLLPLWWNFFTLYSQGFSSSSKYTYWLACREVGISHPFCVLLNRFRLESEDLVCSVHPSEPATLQCTQCLRVNLSQSKSLHCTAKCLQDSWRRHLIMHQEAADKRDNGVEDDDSPFTFNSNPAKALRGLDGSLPIHSNGSSYTSPVRLSSRYQKQDTGEVWCEVGQGKTYTPTIEDVGHVLKLECVAIDGSTGRQVAAPHQTQTQKVIPAPSPTPRRLTPLNPESAGEGRSGTFTVLSYNVLSDLFATSELYSYCPPWALAWNYRRQNLLREIVGYRADILCLQEVLFTFCTEANYSTD